MNTLVAILIEKWESLINSASFGSVVGIIGAVLSAIGVSVSIRERKRREQIQKELAQFQNRLRGAADVSAAIELCLVLITSLEREHDETDRDCVRIFEDVCGMLNRLSQGEYMSTLISQEDWDHVTVLSRSTKEALLQLYINGAKKYRNACIKNIQEITPYLTTIETKCMEIAK